MSAAVIGGGLLCMISLSGGIAYAMSGNAATTSNTSPAAGAAVAPAAGAAVAPAAGTTVAPAAGTTVAPAAGTTGSGVTGSPVVTVPTTRGFGLNRMVNRLIVMTPGSPMAGYVSVAGGRHDAIDNSLISTWNLPELVPGSFIRLDGAHVFKVVNVLPTTFNGYFIDASGNQKVTYFSGRKNYTRFETGTFTA